MIKSVYEIVNELLVENENELNDSLNEYVEKTDVLNESITSSPKIIKEFIRFCKQEIGFQTHPIVTFTRKKEQTKTLGHNDISNNKIMVYIQDRLLADVMRTLAHELVHTKQKDLNVLNADSGNDGSEHENEANSKAGEILRKFGKKFPEIYSSKFPVNTYKNTYLDNNIIKESDGVYEYGCLMLKLNIDNWKDVIGKINDDDLYMKEDDGGYGKEKNPHVTILYGFLPTTDYSDVERVLSKLKKPIPITINQLSLFKNEEFDVLKYDVSGKALHSLNKLFSERYENENKYTEYIPHCTVAYIIKGQADKYITSISPLKIYCDEFIYSFPNGEKKTYKITSQVEEARKNPELNVKTPPIEEIKNILKKYNKDDLFLSFRNTIHVGDINPKNKFNTPTGFYTYPVSQYYNNILKCSSYKEFIKLFPFASDRKFVYFFNLTNREGIFENETDISLLDKYVNKIKTLYSKNTSIVNLCYNFLDRKYQSYYSESVNSTHLFWLFLFDVCAYIASEKNYKTKSVYKLLCNQIGVNGFIDSGLGWIHHNEPSQAVFFKVKTIGKVIQISSEKDKQYSYEISTEEYRIFSNKNKKKYIDNISYIDFDKFKVSDDEVISYYIKTKPQILLSINEFDFIKNKPNILELYRKVRVDYISKNIEEFHTFGTLLNVMEIKDAITIIDNINNLSSFYNAKYIMDGLFEKFPILISYVLEHRKDIFVNIVPDKYIDVDLIDKDVDFFIENYNKDFLINIDQSLILEFKVDDIEVVSPRLIVNIYETNKILFEKIKNIFSDGYIKTNLFSRRYISSYFKMFQDRINRFNILDIIQILKNNKRSLIYFENRCKEIGDYIQDNFYKIIDINEILYVFNNDSFIKCNINSIKKLDYIEFYLILINNNNHNFISNVDLTKLKDKKLHGALLIEKLYMLNPYIRPYLEDLGLINKNNTPVVTVSDDDEEA